MELSVVDLTHEWLKKIIKPGSFCIDATAGRGKDTAFLCRLAGEEGKVFAFDIQKTAVDTTKQLLIEQGLMQRAEVLLENHINMDKYVREDSVDAIVFNLGYLPGGDHHIATMPSTSIKAIRKGLLLLKKGGVMSICIYSGGDSGFKEKEAVLSLLKELDVYQYTVIVSEFYNRPNHPPVPAIILKR